MSNTIEILDLFNFIKPIDDSIVPGVRPNTYFVSSHGQVFTRRMSGYTPNGNIKYEYDPIGSISNKGYSKVSVRCVDKSRKSLSTQKVVAQAYLPPLPESININDMGVRFKDGDRTNLRASNLEWVTRNELLQEARDARDDMTAENSPSAVFTNNEVHQICKMLQDGFPYGAILDYLGKPRTQSNLGQVSKIKTRITWNSISKDYNFPNKR